MAHKKLEAWKESMKLVVEIYKITQQFPQSEIYGLVNQIRRSAVSIPSNLAEGCARQTSKDTIHFLHIGLGSIAELETQILISNELGYMKNTETILNNLVLTRKLILGLIKHYKIKETK